jgi:hypothetical protein
MEGVERMSYTIVSYGDWSEDGDKHCFGAKTKRQVVGLMKTIMDNFDPVHVDILLDGSQNDLNRRGNVE